MTADIAIAIGIDASEAKVGRDAIVRYMDDIASAADRAFKGGDFNIRATAGTFSSLSDALTRTSAATRITADAAVSYTTSLARLDYQLGLITKTDLEYAQAEAKIGAALRANIITVDQATTRYAALNARLDSATLGSNRAGQGFRNSGTLLQQFGLQASDVFAVMSTGGNVVGQLGIQVGRFLGVLGPWGALAGAAATGMGLLATGMLKTGDATADATKAERDYASTLEQANALTQTAIDLQRQKADATRAAAGTAIAQQRAQAMADFMQAGSERQDLILRVEKQERTYGEGHADLVLTRQLDEVNKRFDGAFDRLTKLEQAARDIDAPKVGSALWEQNNQGRISATEEIAAQMEGRGNAAKDYATERSNSLDALGKAAEGSLRQYREALLGADDYIKGIQAQRDALSMSERDAAIFRAGLQVENNLRKVNGGILTEQAKGYAELAKAEAAALYDEGLSKRTADDLQTQQYGIELLRQRIALVGESESAQAQELSVMQAMYEMHARYGATLPEEAQAYINNAETAAMLTAELERQQGAINELSQFGERAFDRIGSAATQMAMEGGNSWRSMGNVGMAVLSELSQEMFRLAAINPLKNLLFGTSATTLADIGGVIGKIFGGSAIAYSPNFNSTVGAGASYSPDLLSLTTPWAKGGAFENSPSLSAYSGSIVDRPTYFAFAKGAGVMGEAGPEAIMPLQRDSSGRLGVSASLSSAATVGAGSADPSVVVIDQRTVSSKDTGQGISVQRAGIGADGRHQLKVIIHDVVAEGLASGRHDKTLLNNFGVTRKGRM